jgi:hypothetical protein
MMEKMSGLANLLLASIPAFAIGFAAFVSSVHAA